MTATPSEEWNLVPGSLRGQLETWAYRAGYQLIWKAQNDLEMQTKASFRGDFLSAVKSLFVGLYAHGNLLRATLYEDNKVLEVMGE